MSNQIVQVNVTQLAASAPSLLQRTGAFISQGGTTLDNSTYSLLTQYSDLADILQPADGLATLSQSSGTATATVKNTTIASGTYNGTTGAVTLTLTADIGLTAGRYIYVSGATGTGSYASINGLFKCIAGTSGTTAIYTVATSLTMTISGGNVYNSHGVATSSTFITTIAGATPSAYNGTVLATATNAYQFTFSIASGTSSPATGTITYTPYGVCELQAMATTFFDQGNGASVYVLELGQGTPAEGVTALTTYIADPPLPFYGYLLPVLWADESTAVTLATNNEGLTKKVYFWQQTTLSNYSSWEGPKSVISEVQSTDAPLTEFTLAALFYNRLNLNPSATNKLTPTAFQYQFGVTAYSTLTNTQMAALKAAFVNYITTGAEGGITNKIVKWGVTSDGRDFSYWYSVDWAQIQVAIALAAAVINGSNDPVNPLYYDQSGINTLQAVAQGVFNAGASFGMFTGTPQVTAIPFSTYVAANPSDFAAGIYNGLSVTMTPSRGFTSITFNLVVSDIPTS